MEVRRMRPKPKVNPLDKRIIPNPRYNKVETVLDTGNNLRKELERLEEVQLFYKFRNDEIFRRVNVNNLVRLVIEVSRLEQQLAGEVRPEDSASEWAGSLGDEAELQGREEELEEELEEEEDIGSLIQSQFLPRAPTGRSRTRRSSASQQCSLPMLGEQEAEREERPAARPFLLLDVREEEEFQRGSLALAHNYPLARLNRCYDYETADMVRLRNRPRAVIVLLDWDESLAARGATTLTQRGYDNVFLLSGGLRVAGRKFPESLLSSGGPPAAGLGEGEVMVLERLLEENILAGSSGRSSRPGSQSQGSQRQGSQRQGSQRQTLRRSASMDTSRSRSFDGPIRTSTAMRNRI